MRAIGKYIESRVSGSTTPFKPYREQVCRGALCMEKEGSVPVLLQFWASCRTAVGFCEVGELSPCFPPATDSCRVLTPSFTARQCAAGQYSLHLPQKNSDYLGRGICTHSSAARESGPALPTCPQRSHLAQSHISTYSYLVPASLGLLCGLQRW